MRVNLYESETLVVRVRGQLACFTMPEFRCERMSNVVASHSGWEGVLSAVMGHKGSWYQIEKVALLFNPRWMPITQNEIEDFGNGKKPIRVEKVRTLRTTSMLCGDVREDETGQTTAGVDYLVWFKLVSNDASKFQENWRMLAEDRLGIRLEKEKWTLTNHRIRTNPDDESVRYFRQPALGLRELIGDVEPVLESDLDPILKLVSTHYNQPLGITYYGRDWRDTQNSFPHYFTELTIRKGVCVYPTWEQVRKHGIRRFVKAA